MHQQTLDNVDADADRLRDEYLLVHKGRIVKHGGKTLNQTNSGGPTYYPCTDTIYAEVIIWRPGYGATSTVRCATT